MAITNATRLSDFASGIGTQGAVLKVDNTNQRIGLGTDSPTHLVTAGAVGASGTTLFVYGDSRITGVLTATSFYGSGANLTNLPSSATSVPGINTAGFSTFKEIAVSGVATFKGNVDANGALDVDGATTLDGLTVAEAAAFSANVKVSGIATFGAGVTISSDFIHIGDNKKIQLGIASDLTIQHNATNSVINNTTGQLRLAGDDLRLLNKDEDETYATFANDGAASLYYDNTSKIETISAGASVYGGLRLEGGGLMREHLDIDNTALNSGPTINLSDGMVHYRSAAVGAANVKLNVISSAGINTDMAIGDVMTVTVITVAGSTSHFVDQIRIDGVEATAGVTTNWSGGAAPTAGGGSGIDSYAFNIMKTANATYVVLAAQTLTS